MLQLAGEREDHVLLGQGRTDGCSDFAAAVGGIDQHEESWSRRSLRRLRGRQGSVTDSPAELAVAGNRGRRGDGAPVTTMVFPPSAKFAISAEVPVTSSSAMPSCSEKFAPVIRRVGVGRVVHGGDHGFAPEGEANMSRLGRNRGIYWRIEAHEQLRRLALAQVQA